MGAGAASDPAKSTASVVSETANLLMRRNIPGAEDALQLEVNQRAVTEMFRQVGPLRMDASGIAYRGMCIRHLVLPGNRAHSKKILGFLNTHFDPDDISLSLMAQYRPMFNAACYEELSQPLCDNDYSPIKKQFLDAGFCGYVQDIGQLDTNFCIDFSSRKNEALTGE